MSLDTFSHACWATVQKERRSAFWSVAKLDVAYMVLRADYWRTSARTLSMWIALQGTTKIQSSKCLLTGYGWNSSMALSIKTRPTDSRTSGTAYRMIQRLLHGGSTGCIRPPLSGDSSLDWTRIWMSMATGCEASFGQLLVKICMQKGKGTWKRQLKLLEIPFITMSPENVSELMLWDLHYFHHIHKCRKQNHTDHL